MNSEIIKRSKVLIIDDQPLTQIFLKQSLEKIGFETIRLAESATHALRLTDELTFNVIICSFNLSRDKDGYHLFEELKSKGAVKLTTTFIFTSAETDAALVNSVIELQPDDFLVKPFTAKELSDRLTRVLKRKQQLNRIYKAIDNKQLKSALKLIDDSLKNKSHSALHPILYRLKGDLLIAEKQYKLAIQFYNQILELQSFTWAQVGLAKAFLGLNQESDAKQILQGLISKPETKLAALDLLAHYYIEHDEYEMAFKQFKSATTISPRNINRHKHVVNLARLLHDHENQYEAAKTMVKYAKKSLHETSDLYLLVARAGIDYALTLSDSEAFNVIKQSERYLENLHDNFPSTPESKDKIAIIQARIHYLKDEKEKANALVKDVENNLMGGSLEDYIDQAKAFHELGQQDKAVNILSNLDMPKATDMVSEKILTQYLNQERQEKTDIPFSPKALNNMAVQFYNSKRLEPAIQAFDDAMRLMPTNIRIAMNLLQALVELKLRQPLSDQHQAIYKKVTKSINKTELTTAQQERYEQLQKRSKNALRET